jgi:hypothetical protein
LTNPVPDALDLIVESGAELLKNFIQLFGVGGHHSFGAQVANAVFEAARLEMPAKKTAHEETFWRLCFVHKETNPNTLASLNGRTLAIR